MPTNIVDICNFIIFKFGSLFRQNCPCPNNLFANIHEHWSKFWHFKAIYKINSVSEENYSFLVCLNWQTNVRSTLFALFVVGWKAYSEVGIYKKNKKVRKQTTKTRPRKRWRKKENKNSTKKAMKKTRKQELDQESDQENKKTPKKKRKNFLFFSITFLAEFLFYCFLIFLLSCFLL